MQYSIPLIIIAVCVGWVIKKLKKANPEKFLMGNRQFGTILLLFTLYASQYSTNSFVGMTAKAYGIGFYSFVFIMMMQSVILFYMVHMKTLYHLSKKYKFITLGDWIWHRFRSKTLVQISAWIMLYALTNFIFSNLIGVAYFMEGIIEGGHIYEKTVISLVIVVLLYEVFGGIKAVVWTDFFQGLIVGGTIIIIIIMLKGYVTGEEIHQAIVQEKESFSFLTSYRDIIRWISFTTMVAIGASIYPHAIHRVYIAKSYSTLVKSLKWMVVIPIMIVVPLITISLFGKAIIHTDNPSNAFGLIIKNLASGHPWVTYIAILGVSFAALSTIDSCLIVISSIVGFDLTERSHSSQEKMAKVKGFSIWFTVVLGCLAIFGKGLDLIDLMVWKMDFLVQIFPLVVFGIYSKEATKRHCKAGLVVGLIGVSLCCIYRIREIGGIDIGLWSLAINMLVTGLALKIYQVGSISKEIDGK